MRFSSLIAFALFSFSAVLAAPASVDGAVANVEAKPADVAVTDSAFPPGPIGPPWHGGGLPEVVSRWQRNIRKLRWDVPRLHNRVQYRVYRQVGDFVRDLAEAAHVRYWNRNARGPELFDEWEKMLKNVKDVGGWRLERLEDQVDDILREVREQGRGGPGGGHGGGHGGGNDGGHGGGNDGGHGGGHGGHGGHDGRP